MSEEAFEDAEKDFKDADDPGQVTIGDLAAMCKELDPSLLVLLASDKGWALRCICVAFRWSETQAQGRSSGFC